MESQMSLLEPQLSMETRPQINIVHGKFLKSGGIDYDVLFSGFDHLYALTFSYGLNFINEIVQKFDHAEIVLGCEAMVKFDMKMIMAHQTKTLQNLLKYKKLVERVQNDEILFWVTNSLLSHDKVYIMNNEVNDDSRVVVGSANFSKRAFNNYQNESLICFENDHAALDFYMEYFQTIKRNATNNIVKEALYVQAENDQAIFEEIPICKEAKVKDAGIIIDESKPDEEEVEYVIDLKNISKKYAPVVPEKEKKGHLRGKILLTPTKVTLMRKKFREVVEDEKEKRKEFPQFIINFETKEIEFNGHEYKLEFDPVKSKQNVESLCAYFLGFDEFIGNTEQMKRNYFNIMNYLFLSPFIACLRYEANKNDFPIHLFPKFALISGVSNGGKSEFVRTIQKLMFGKMLQVNSEELFKATALDPVFRQAYGVPILIDDVKGDRFRTHKKIIKDDYSTINEKLLYHPTIILTSNDIKSLEPEFTKRLFCTHIEARMPRIQATATHRKMAELRRSMTNDFYKEYLIEMFNAVDSMINEMKNSRTVQNEWLPDVFKVSSNIILNLFQRYNLHVPEYVREVTYDNDYFGDHAVGIRVYEKLRRDWRYNRAAFVINKKMNNLEYTPGENGYEAAWICNEAPAELNAHQSGRKVIMELDKTEEFIDLKLRRGWFRK